MHSATVFDCVLIDETPSSLTLEIQGKKAKQLFEKEAGGHRWQRVPPTEKKGRRHTSTVTVAVLDVDVAAATAFDEREIEWDAVRGSGKGGQARNKTSNAVQLLHIPSGIRIRVESDRSQWNNRVSALRILDGKLRAREKDRRQAERNDDRRDQVGSGQRGDKIRTARDQDNRVTDHRTGKKTTLYRYARGHIEDLL